MHKPGYRCGFVSILGRPNAGKSTLLNRILGEKVAIVADKPQTTRTIIQGVLTRDDAQIVFMDTPGLHHAETRINQRMMEQARMAVQDRDLILYMVDATRGFSSQDERAVQILKDARTPAFLLLNKVDALEDKPRLLELLAKYKDLHDFEEYLPISAETGEAIDDMLLPRIVAKMPESEAIFPDDYLTDQPMRFIAAELVREKVLHHTHEEVPHSVTVWVEEFVEKPNVTYINATILVERSGQKKIIVGHGGEMIKRIGAEARLDIERMLDGKVFLELFVKVRENWRERNEYLDTLDWRTQMASLPEGEEEDA